MSKKSFHYKGLLIELHKEVYDPAEDTFLLLEALNVKKGEKVFELGTGCGVVALECARIGADVVCSDINPFAIELTKKNYEKNKNLITGNISIRFGDLYKIINPDEKFDLVIFNPPYLPTDKEITKNVPSWLDIATDGGVDGLRITKKFIDNLDKCLKKTGRAFFVFSSFSNRNKLEYYLKKKNFRNKILKSYKFNDESIDVYLINY